MQQGHTGVIENGREEERKRQREQLPPCNLLCLGSSQRDDGVCLATVLDQARTMTDQGGGDVGKCLKAEVGI